MSRTIDSALRWWATEQADRAAIVVAGDRVNYGQLNQWVGALAEEFIRLGVAPGDRVCIGATNSVEWCVSWLACLRCAGIASSLSTRLVSPEIADLLGEYSPRVLVVDEEFEVKLPDLATLTARNGASVGAPQLISTAHIHALRASPIVNDVRIQIDPHACAAIVTTSGSTAKPKGVMYSNNSMIEYALAQMAQEKLSTNHTNWLVAMSLSTGAGQIQFSQCMTLGGTLYPLPAFDPEVALELITQERITALSGAPIFFERIAAVDGFEAADVSSLEIAHTGGAAVPVPLLQRWAKKGVLLRQIYGQTECGGCGTVNPRRYALSHPEFCGHGSEFGCVAIIDKQGRFVGRGEMGQIVLQVPGTMLGYWNNPEATRDVLVDGWLWTGDIGIVNELGLLKFIDRAKEMIISGGMNISAAEVEGVIAECDGVNEVAVFAVPDDRFGETPLAIVYSTSSVNLADIVSHCNVRMSDYKVPRYMIHAGIPFPRLATGKISKTALKEHYITGKALPERVR